MSHFDLVVKMRHGLTTVSVPAQFSFYTFGVRRDIKVCAVCPEGVAIEISVPAMHKISVKSLRKASKKFLAHSTVYNYFRFATPQ